MAFETCGGRNLRITPPDPDAIIAALAACQHGVVALAQLPEAGLDQYAIRRRVQAGRLHRLYRGVYAVGHVGLSFEARCMAAALASGPNAAVSHLTAAELFQVSRWAAPRIAVVTATQRAPAGVDVHRARRLHPLDVTTFKYIPITTVARMLVDLSETLTPHQLAYVIHQAAYRHRFDLAATRRAMNRANGRHTLRPSRARARAAPERLRGDAQRQGGRVPGAPARRAARLRARQHQARGRLPLARLQGRRRGGRPGAPAAAHARRGRAAGRGADGRGLRSHADRAR